MLAGASRPNFDSCEISFCVMAGFLFLEQYCDTVCISSSFSMSGFFPSEQFCDELCSRSSFSISGFFPSEQFCDELCARSFCCSECFHQGLKINAHYICLKLTMNEY